MRTRFINALIYDGGLREPYLGELTVFGDTIELVVAYSTPSLLVPAPKSSEKETVVDCGGHTLMPGLVEGHAHLTFANTFDNKSFNFDEHMLITKRNALKLLDAGFTSAFSAASAELRAELIVRNDINAGRLRGPRLLAASPDIVSRPLDAEEVVKQSGSVAAVIKSVEKFVALGFDTIKVTVGGEGALSREELVAAAGAARAAGVRMAAQCNDSEAVHMALDCGVEVIFHCEDADSDALERLSTSNAFHAPAIGFLVSHKGVMPHLEEQYQSTRAAYRALHEAAPGAHVVVGGDYGFPLTPQGSNARDLQHFVDELGYSTLEALRAATSVGGELMRLPVGRLSRGYLADVLLVRGDVSKDVALLQSRTNLLMIMKGGHMHKRPAAKVSWRSPVVADSWPIAPPPAIASRDEAHIPKLDLSRVAKRCVWIDGEGSVHKRCVWPDADGNFVASKRCVWVDGEGSVHKRCVWPDADGNFVVSKRSDVSQRCFNPDDLPQVDSRCVIIDDPSHVSQRSCFNPDDLLKKRCIWPDGNGNFGTDSAKKQKPLLFVSVADVADVVMGAAPMTPSCKPCREGCAWCDLIASDAI